MGSDKALLGIDGEPLWQRQVGILRKLAPNELFIAGPHRAEGAVTIRDALPNCGPIAGLLAALRRSSAPLLVVLAVDLPRMTSNYLGTLLESCRESVGAVPRGQPLAAVYPSASQQIAEECCAKRQYAVQDFASTCISRGLVRQIEIAPDEQPLFLNLNTPEDVQALHAKPA